MVDKYYAIDNPRLTVTLPLAADTPLDLRAFIEAGLTANLSTLFGADAAALSNFLANISWKIGRDSSIGNAGAGELYVLTRFTVATPTINATAAHTYGVEIPADEERTCSGHARYYMIYSEDGTNVSLDLWFETGS